MEFPFISCKCITYGRVGTLEESLESFLKQDYPGKKELIIVNDYPLQKLVFDHPEVKIYNLDETFSTIGEKENYATNLCSADIICQWDDDDIAMPNHLRNVSKYFKEDTNLLHWKHGVYYNEPVITNIEWIGNCGIVFNKNTWKAIGGHPVENAGYDMTFVHKLHDLDRSKIVLADPPFEEVSWWYMWGGRGYHMSGAGTDADHPTRPNVIKRHSEHIEQLRIVGKIPTGNVKLSPQWNKDYIQMLKDYVSKRNNSK